jgi:hypothetical protein
MPDPPSQPSQTQPHPNARAASLQPSRLVKHTLRTWDESLSQRSAVPSASSPRMPCAGTVRRTEAGEEAEVRESVLGVSSQPHAIIARAQRTENLKRRGKW